MGNIPTRAQAFDLLCRHNKEEFHLKHAQTVEGVMRVFAVRYGHDPDFWGLVGLLHDLDFEEYPEQHCLMSQTLLREAGVDESIVRATASHGHGLTVDLPPEHFMEKVLFATDELTGLIGACALMRPSKSTLDMELKSLKKKYKTPAFAAGCSREVIGRGADMLGWELDRLLQETLEAMRAVEQLTVDN
ncbi:MAG: hydrolase [Oscillospiraceae bacterium]|jgi:predicted hydrolase (HD superfamily)|nr:hydrolase [Oscillospiraceae bacterium]